MSNGNLSEYMREHPDVGKLGLVCGRPRHRHQLLNDPDPQPIPAIRRRSRVDLPTSV